ncbi:MAG: hypothetical protein AB7Q42_17625 [Acidimicrobiia bacterium]
MRDDRLTDDRRSVLLMHDLIGEFTINRPNVSLPFVVAVVAEDRQLNVDGIERTFRGARVDGDSRWVGECDLDLVRLRVATRSPSDLAVSQVDDAAALPEFPPDLV